MFYQPLIISFINSTCVANCITLIDLFDSNILKGQEQILSIDLTLYLDFGRTGEEKKTSWFLNYLNQEGKKEEERFNLCEPIHSFIIFSKGLKTTGRRSSLQVARLNQWLKPLLLRVSKRYSIIMMEAIAL